MLHKIFVSIAVSIAASLLSQTAHAENIPKKANDLIELEILSFGTSNVRGGVRYISEIAEASGGYRISHTQWILNNMNPKMGLAGLWNAIQENENNFENNDKTVKQDGKSVREYLQSEKWDVIILASHKLTSNLFSGFTSDKDRRAEYEALPHCLKYIKKFAPQARLFFYNTYLNGPSYDEIEEGRVESRLRHAKKKGSTMTPFELFLQDTKSDIQRCQDICREFSLEMIPVRQALWLAHVDPTWGYIFTPTNKELPLVLPHLPTNYFRPSLHVGYEWRKGKDGGKPVLGSDLHIGMPGCYMVGSLIFQALTGEDAIGNSFVPKQEGLTWNGKGEEVKLDTFETISADECKILQVIAAKAMKMKNDSPEIFIQEYMRMRKTKLENKEKGVYKRN
jgi:hypothetical protein